jgi:membrane dipeptidase
MDHRLGTVDLHTHPSMLAYMFRTRFWKPQRPAAYGFYPWAMRVNLDTLLAGGVKAFLCTTYVLERTMYKDVWPLNLLAHVHPRFRHMATAPPDMLTREYLDAAERMIEETRRRRGDVIAIARSFADYQRITDEGKICMLHAIEGAHHLNGNIDMVDELYKRGVCLMVIPHLYPNEAGGCVDLVVSDLRLPWLPGCFHPKHQDRSGLSRWGGQLVEKLLEVGIIVDPTHGTREFRKQVLDIARSSSKKRPVVMSHVNVPGKSFSHSGLDPLPEDIREIADTGGVVGLIMYYHAPSDAQTMTGVESVLRAIDYLIRYGGEDVVAFGSDFDGYFATLPRDIRSPRGYNALREAMRRKYTDAQVAKFMNGNAERVLKAGWGK